MTISQRKRLLIDIALSAKSAENPSATGLDQGSPSAGERAAPLRSIMPPSKKGPSMEPGPSEREGDDDDGESTASRRRYHDALSTGVGMDARVHGTARERQGTHAAIVAGRRVLPAEDVRRAGPTRRVVVVQPR
jgi:hypothetical protein